MALVAFAGSALSLIAYAIGVRLKERATSDRAAVR